MKHNYSTLIDFLKTGRLGELKLGIMADDVLDYLGDPDKLTSNTTFDKTFVQGVLCYGCLHLVFRQKKLQNISIRINNYPEYSLPPELEDGWLASVWLMNRSEYQLFLRQHGIQHTEYVHAFFYYVRHTAGHSSQRIAHLTAMRNPF